MSKDVNIHVKATDADASKAKLDQVAQSAQKVGDKVSAAGKKGAQETDKLAGSTEKAQKGFGKLLSSVAGWAAGLVSVLAAIRLVTSAINTQKRAIEEHGQIAAAQQESLLRLQYLGGFFKEHPEARKEVAALSELGRRPFEEVADAWYNLRSKGAGLSATQKRSIMLESLEMGRTDPSMPLNTLVDMFSLYAKQTGQTDINRIQNVLLQTITEAGGGGADVARYMPQFLPVGITGGLSGPQAAGLWSYVTTQLADPSIATTGLRATFMGLQGKGSPESQKILAELGVSSGMGFFEKTAALSQAYQGGRLSLGQAEQLAGREGAAVLLSILKNPEAMMQTIASVGAADTGGIDMTRSMIDQLIGSDEIARVEEESRRMGVVLQNQKASNINALRWRLRKQLLEKAMRQGGAPEWQISMNLSLEDLRAGLGFDIGDFENFSYPGMPGAGQGATINNNTNYFPKIGAAEKGPRYSQDE